MADNPQTEVEISSVSGSPTDIRNITGTVSLPTGAATESTLSAQNTLIGAVTETAPANDTASSGLNGRLQRIAQRLTSIFTTQTDGSQQSKIRGNTDGTLIGNSSDALKVTLPAPKTFVVRQSAVQIANGKSMLSIQNATGSAVKVKIREIWIKNVQTAGVAGIISQWELNRFTSHSGGTLLTPRANESSDVLDLSITARTGATISGTEFTFFRWLWSTDEWGAGPSDVESFDHAFQNTNPVYRVQPNMKPITLLANEAIHLKQVFNSTVGTFDIEIVFTEETT
jgi:hypothetical protein